MPLAFWVTDACGHSTRYSPRALQANGWPAALQVRALPDALPPRVKRVSGSDVRLRGPVRVRFTEPVNGLTEASALIQQVDIESDELGPPSPGTWRCRDDGRDLTDCGTGSVRRAAFHLYAPLVADQEYQLVLNPEHVLMVTDLAGNPVDRDRLFRRSVTLERRVGGSRNLGVRLGRSRVAWG
jgi:hypothetical protein